MKNRNYFSYCLILLGLASCNETTTMNTKVDSKIDYPTINKGETIDNYYGTEVSDPYRWLEDANSAETKTWVNAQNEVTFNYLEEIPFRQKVKDRLTEIWNVESFSTPFKENGKYYFFKNDGLQNQSVLYVQDKLDEEATVLLDPNTFSDDGTSSLSGLSFSEDGKYLAYGIAEGGSDWKTAYLMDLNSKEKMTDKVEWIKFSGMSWAGNGFYYSRYDIPKEGEDKLSKKNEFHRVYYHKIGEDQGKDQLVYMDKAHPLRNFYAQTTEDERFLILNGSESTSGNSLAYLDLKAGQKELTQLIEDFDNDRNVIDNIGDKLLVLVNDGAPNKRLVLIDPKQAAEDKWETLIPEAEQVIRSVRLIGGKIVVSYIKDANSLVKVFTMDGKFDHEVELPGMGTVGGFSGKKKEAQCFFNFTSFKQPNTIYSYDINTKEKKVFKASKVDFNPDDYVMKQVFYKSADGEKIPMFITHKKGIKLDGSNPTLLYGYGGFDISILPSFSTPNMLWMEQGGVYASANLRGGGEYGEKWHKAGTKLNKQNVFNDFIAAAEYLIAEKYTTSEKLAIEGRSNGGLLVGACLTQRPDLFKVALPAVGVLDMLRYHKFTIGWAWATDYGSSEDSIQFKNLMTYSPLHNTKKGVEYPATLVTTADHDDRVVPAHSFKFISQLQEDHQGANPVLIRVETSAGHGAGKSKTKLIEERADILAFTWHNMGHEFQKFKH